MGEGWAYRLCCTVVGDFPTSPTFCNRSTDGILSIVRLSIFFNIFKKQSILSSVDSLFVEFKKNTHYVNLNLAFILLCFQKLLL